MQLEKRNIDVLIFILYIKLHVNNESFQIVEGKHLFVCFRKAVAASEVSNLEVYVAQDCTGQSVMI